MAEEVSNLIMEQLQILRRGQESLLRGQDAIRAELTELKTRITGLGRGLIDRSWASLQE
jgi:hypothetical protein